MELTPEGLDSLRRMPSLTSLGVLGCKLGRGRWAGPGEKVTLEDLEALKGLPITTIWMFGNGGCMGVGCLGALMKMRLTWLSLHACPGVTDALMREIRKLPLTALELPACSGYTTAGLEVLRGLPLTLLDLACSNAVEDGSLLALQGMPLTRLGLNWCQKVTSIGVGHLRDLPLTSLNLAWCELVVDAALEVLLGMPTLVELNVYECTGLSAEGRESVAGLQKAWSQMYPYCEDGAFSCPDQHGKSSQLVRLRTGTLHGVGRSDGFCSLDLRSISGALLPLPCHNCATYSQHASFAVPV